MARQFMHSLTAIVLILFAWSCSVDGADDTTLRLVHILARHGDRGPTSSYPTNPIPNSAWRQGLGHLTQLGINQTYHLGRFIRNKYNSFINDTYVNQEVYIRSTDFDRNLMSAEAMLAGLYPPVPSQLWNPAIDWQPIPVHTKPEKEDPLLRMHVPCPKAEQLYSAVLASDAVKAIEEEYSELFKVMVDETGLSHITIDQVGYDLWDCLNCERIHGFPRSSWLDETRPSTGNVTVGEVLENVGVVWADQYMYLDKGVQKLRGGLFVNELVTHMRAKASNTLEPKERILFYYSAHEVTLAAIMSALGIYDNISPGFASALFFELHEVDVGIYAIRISYRNDPSASGTDRALPIPACGGAQLCAVELFYESVANITIANEADFHSQCQVPTPRRPRPVAVLEIIAIATVAVMLITAISIGCKIHKDQKRQAKRKEYIEIGKRI